MRTREKTPKLVYQCGRIFTKARLERLKRVSVGWTSVIEEAWLERYLPDCLEEIEAVLVYLELVKERKPEVNENSTT